MTPRTRRPILFDLSKKESNAAIMDWILILPKAISKRRAGSGASCSRPLQINRRQTPRGRHIVYPDKFGFVEALPRQRYCVLRRSDIASDGAAILPTEVGSDIRFASEGLRFARAHAI